MVLRRQWIGLAVLGDCGLNHGNALVHDGVVALNQLSQRCTDGAAVGAAHLTQALLDHGVHIAMAGAQLVDDAAALVLQVQSGSHIAGLHQLV